jgi:hypothetical protein
MKEDERWEEEEKQGGWVGGREERRNRGGRAGGDRHDLAQLRPQRPALQPDLRRPARRLPSPSPLNPVGSPTPRARRGQLAAWNTCSDGSHGSVGHVGHIAVVAPTGHIAPTKARRDSSATPRCGGAHLRGSRGRLGGRSRALGRGRLGRSGGADCRRGRRLRLGFRLRAALP